MISLGIQTAIGPASVCLLKNEKVIGKRCIGERFEVCKRLSVEISLLLKELEKEKLSLGLISVCLGPGSFTGIRIGVATAKALTHSLNIPLVGVNTLEALARIAAPGSTPIITLMEAGKSRYFTAIYESKTFAIKESAIISESELDKWLLGSINSIKEDTDCVMKAPTVVMSGKINENIEIRARELGAKVVSSFPDCEEIASIGLKRFAEAGGENPILLQPLYLRASSPEERAGIKLN